VTLLIPTVADRTEAELIAAIQAHLAPSPDWIAVGIGDDAAVVSPERNRLEVLTVDALVEGVHFDRRFVSAGAIGYRALAVNLSDLAAMGAQPRLALLSLALPSSLPLCDFDALAAGFAQLAGAHHVHLVGGNLTKTTGPMVIDVTAIGTVKARNVLTRSGARAGDEVYVTGSLGAAAAGLAALRSGSNDTVLSECIARYVRPEPRVRIGALLGRNRAASACVDASDGLADAIHHLARASRVGIAIDAAALPIEPAARQWFEREATDPVNAAITGGDDYELVFTVRPRLRRRLKTIERQGRTAMTCIGVCTAQPDVVLRRGTADEPLPLGYGHFR
jgi:thiamine-monophosphate kinase